MEKAGRFQRLQSFERCACLLRVCALPAAGWVCVQEGQELELPTGFWVRPFPTVHPVPSQVSVPVVKV